LTKAAETLLPSLPLLALAVRTVAQELLTLPYVGFASFSGIEFFTDFDLLIVPPYSGAVGALLWSCSFFVGVNIRGIRDDCVRDTGLLDSQLEAEIKVNRGLQSVGTGFECDILKDSFGG
jgi:hypothetical protein